MSIFRRKDDAEPRRAADTPEAEEAGAGDSTETTAPEPGRVRDGTIVPRPLGRDLPLGGRIVSPRNGVTLSGVVQIEVQAAETDGAVDRVEVEYSRDGDHWAEVGAVTDEPYDLFAVIGDDGPPVHVAVVRSWRLAQFFRLVLESQPELDFERIEIRTSETHPWEQARGTGTAWNTSGIGDGAYRLRAISVSGGGVRVTTPEVEVVVDNSGPEVALVAPARGSEIEGSVLLKARAEDAGSAVEEIAFEYSHDGENWHEIGTRDAAPWELGWDVDDIPAGEVRLRVRARDSRGHEQASVPVRVTIANAPATVALEPLPSQLRGRIDLAATVDHPERVTEVEFQLEEEGGDSWLTVASATEAPYAAVFDTTVLADGRYELRASAVVRGGRTSVTDPRPHGIDNTPPIVRLDVPDNGYVAGRVNVEARAHDEGSGIDRIVIELRPEDGRWTELARADEQPVLEHEWDTRKLADGHYDMRVVAADRAGNEWRPEIVALVVDNTAPLAEIIEPKDGDTVGGVVPIGAEIVDSCSGLAWLKYEWSGADGEWHELPRGPGSVSWHTAEVADGEYVLRVRAADRAGNVTTSDSVALAIDNAAKRAARAAADSLAAQRAAAGEDAAAPAQPAAGTRFGPIPTWSWQEAPAADEALEGEAAPEPELEPDFDVVTPEDTEPAEPPTAAEPEPEPEPEAEPERRRLAAVEEPEPEEASEPAPAPEPDAEPAALVFSLPRGGRSWGLWELDRLVEDHAEDDPIRTEERRAVLYFLRDHAALDGTIPPEFESVVQETFGDLLAGEGL
jgi:hypothetical protein